MDIMEISWKGQRWAEGYVKGLGSGKYGRVLKMAKKPDAEEYKRTLQITSIGAITIGALGFLIYLIWNNGPAFFRSLLGI
ncbi:MAG: protein translocase SEC61 complex subunit gamma [Euryarchaeota archaeon]|nr:protein translocase SEC61 complex subunit gamma [Euryarchaeota archaeon]